MLYFSMPKSIEKAKNELFLFLLTIPEKECQYKPKGTEDTNTAVSKMQTTKE